MVQLTIFLLVLAIVALLVEIFTGTEVFGIVGIIALIVSGVMAVLFITGGWFVVAGQVVIFAVFVRLFIRQIQRKQAQGKIFLNETLAEDIPAYELSSFVGKDGIAVTALRPYGEADFDGVRVEVSSGGPMIEKGTKIRATTLRESSLIVRESKGN